MRRRLISTAWRCMKFMKDRFNFNAQVSTRMRSILDRAVRVYEPKWNGRGDRREKERGQYFIYFFRTESSLPITSNLDYCRCFRRRTTRPEDRNFILFAVRSTHSPAYVSYVVLLFVEVFHEDCGVRSQNLKWMLASVSRYVGGFFPYFFFFLLPDSFYLSPPYRNLFSQITFPLSLRRNSVQYRADS